jgi:hypothetical protein
MPPFSRSETRDLAHDTTRLTTAETARRFGLPLRSVVHWCSRNSELAERGPAMTAAWQFHVHPGRLAAFLAKAGRLDLLAASVRFGVKLSTFDGRTVGEIGDLIARLPLPEVRLNRPLPAAVPAVSEGPDASI